MIRVQRLRAKQGYSSYGEYARVMPLAVLCMAGFVKLIPVIQSMPVDLTVLATIVVVVQVAVAIVRRFPVVPHSLLMWLAMAAASASGLLFSPLSEYGAEKTLALAVVTGTAVAGASVLLTSERTVRRFVSVLTVLSLASIGFALGTAQATSANYQRLAIVEGANSLGAGRVAGFLFVVGLTEAFRRHETTRRFTGILIGTVASYALVLSLAQGPGVAAALTVLTIMLMGHDAPVWRSAVWIGFLAVGLGYVTQLAGESQIALYSTLGLSESARLDYFSIAASGLTNPLGHGWGAFAAESATYSRLVGAPSYPHNVWLEALFEGGWLFGGALIALTVVGLKRAFSSQSVAGSVLFASTLYWVFNAAFSGDLNGNRLALVFLTAAFNSRTWRMPLTSKPVHQPLQVRSVVVERR